MSRVYLSVDRCRGAYQLSIGNGVTGYRIAGPKYDGTSQSMLRVDLSARDIREIRRYLDEIAP